ncbi:MAG TPA: response regulator transcription factor [Acidimicrobiia bacterium]|jgi:two-component system KDP operon response regulator KdpE
MTTDPSAPAHAPVVAVVEDDSALRRALRTSLRARGFDVHELATGEGAIVLAADGVPDVVLLDLGLPDIDGIDVIARVREFSAVPVIVLTARDRQSEKVRALDAGADDYVTKPFDTEELVARVRAVLRRAPAGPPVATKVRSGNVEIDLALRSVTVDGNVVRLTRTEWLLLEQLATNPGKLLTHTELLRRVWGTGYGTENEYLRVYVGQLRKKLGDAASAPRLILTEPGIGYRWIGEG